MNIKIDENYSLKSDDRNVILIENKVVQDGKNKGKEYEENIGFYPTVQAAMKGYLRLQTNKSDATTIKELIADVERIEKTIENTLKGI